MNDFPVPPVEPIYKRNSHSFHLLMTILTFGFWALLVWWWWAPRVNRSNRLKRAQYSLALGQYEQEKFEWYQRHRLPLPGTYGH